MQNFKKNSKFANLVRIQKGQNLQKDAKNLRKEAQNLQKEAKMYVKKAAEFTQLFLKRYKCWKKHVLVDKSFVAGTFDSMKKHEIKVWDVITQE